MGTDVIRIILGRVDAVGQTIAVGIRVRDRGIAVVEVLRIPIEEVEPAVVVEVAERFGPVPVTVVIGAVVHRVSRRRVGKVRNAVHVRVGSAVHAVVRPDIEEVRDAVPVEITEGVRRPAGHVVPAVVTLIYGSRIDERKQTVSIKITLRRTKRLQIPEVLHSVGIHIAADVGVPL